MSELVLLLRDDTIVTITSHQKISLVCCKNTFKIIAYESKTYKRPNNRRWQFYPFLLKDFLMSKNVSSHMGHFHNIIIKIGLLYEIQNCLGNSKIGKIILNENHIRKELKQNDNRNIYTLHTKTELEAETGCFSEFRPKFENT